MFAVFVVGAFVVGCIVGSFMNVVTLRFGFVETARDRSACGACQATLRWTDLVPLISFLMLRGRCRECGSRLLWQYPAVELAVGLLFAATLALFGIPVTIGSLLTVIALFAFWAAFVGIVAYDLRHTLVPLPLAYTMIGAAALVRVGVALNGGVWTQAASDALWGALLCAGFIVAVVLGTRGRGMGMGDAYIAGALGVLFGFMRGFEVLMLSFWIGAVVGLVLILAGRGRMKSEVPFAPFMFAAAVVGAFTSLSPLTWVTHLTDLLWT